MLDIKEVKESLRTTQENGQKSWNFPKFGMLAHAFTGIHDKGVTLNYNTKPNEHEHKWTRYVYLHGRKRGVDQQVIYFKLLGEIFLT